MFKNNLVGKRYGKLIVTRFLYSNRVKLSKGNSHTDTYWECQCDCGNKTKVLTRTLNSGDVKSCGCLVQETRLEQKPDTALNELYNGYICRAKNKGFEFSLSKEKFVELTKQNCFYCGVEPKQIKDKDRKYPYVYNGIDRIDSSKGYTEDNSVTCCLKCNKMKLTMSIPEFKSQIFKIIKNMNWEDPT